MWYVVRKLLLSDWYDHSALLKSPKSMYSFQDCRHDCIFIFLQIFNGRQGDRKNVRDVIVLLTDGNSHDDDAAKKEAGLLRDADISIISIGIGEGEKLEKLYNFLKDLSLGSEFVFKVSFTKLDTILDGVTTAACENLQEL